MNALGGVRLPQLVHPMGQYLGTNEGEGFCFLFGGFAPYQGEQLAQRYGSAAEYQARLAPLINQMIEQRFFLAADRAPFSQHVSETIKLLEVFSAPIIDSSLTESR